MRKKLKEKFFNFSNFFCLFLFFLLLIYLLVEISTINTLYKKKREITKFNEKLLEEIANLKIKIGKEEKTEENLFSDFKKQNPNLVRYFRVFSEKLTQKSQ